MCGVHGVHGDVHGGVHDSNAGGARPAVPLSGAQLAPIVGGHNPLEANTTSDDLKFSISPTFNRALTQWWVAPWDCPRSQRS